MNARRRLPNRRNHTVVDFDHQGFRYTASVSRFDDGALGEIFLNASAKIGTAVEAAARDAAVTVSIALQYGTPVDVIRGAVTRDERGRAAGPLGAVLDILAGELFT